jgi:hypothetical protein
MLSVGAAPDLAAEMIYQIPADRGFRGRAGTRAACGAIGQFEHCGLAVSRSALLPAASGLGMLDGIVLATGSYESGLGNACADAAAGAASAQVTHYTGA